MLPDFGLVAGRFRIDGQFIDAHAHEHGHIHDTYVAQFRTSDGVRRYTFQRINEYVFRNVDDLMGNIGAVTEHLRAKVISQGGDPERELSPSSEQSLETVTGDRRNWAAGEPTT